MSRARRSPRLVVSAAAAAFVLALTLLPSQKGLGQQSGAVNNAKTGEGGNLPKDLLKATPFDRLTLVDNTVWLIEPVAPRPLPVWDPVKAKADAKARAKKSASKPGINPKGNVGVDDDKKADAKKDEPLSEDMIIHLIEGDIKDYKIRRDSIKKVEYFEDLLIAEGDRLVIAKEFAKGFEHFLLAKVRDPKWKGLEERVDKLLFDEGSWALVEQDRERGVRLLRELSRRNPAYKELGDKLAAAYGGRINEAIDKGQFPYGRRILHDLEEIAPKNLVIREGRAKYESRAKGLFEDAMKREGAERLEKLTETLRVLPSHEEAASKYAEAFKAMPTLDVAVVDLPRPAGPFIRNPAAARVARLLYLPLLADESAEAIEGKRPDQLAAGLTIEDIGRRVDIKLKSGPAWSDGSRQVGAMDVVRALSDRAQPRSPGYSARWADLLDRVEITDEQTVSVRLNRPIQSPAAWFLGPVGPGHAAWDGRVPSPDGGRKPVGDGPFVAESEGDGLAVYRTAAKDAAPGAAIRRIREVRYPNGSLALGALVRGDVTLVEHVPADRVNALKADPDLKLGTYTRPDLHRLAIDGHNPLLKNRSLRRGMALALDRKGILEENVLRRPIDSNNAPSDGPMAADSPANAADVPPYTPDMLLAKMLVNAGKAEMKVGAVKLSLEYPAIAEAQAAAPRIAEMLKAAGVDVTLTERSESELEEALRSGRRFDLAYRVSKCVEPAWDIGPMLCPGFDAPSSTDALSAIASPRILQLLLQLEHADGSTAKELVTQIDRECRDELPVIPLWQLEDHFAYRGRLKGPAERADHLYQGIDQWQIEPWFAKDPW